MKSKQEIENVLPHFCGSETYHKHSRLFTRFLLTDGANYLAESAECFWLMDKIAELQYSRLSFERFQTWELTVANRQGVLVATDGNGRQIYKGTVSFTDFPLDKIKLFVAYDGSYAVAMLPTEY